MTSAPGAVADLGRFLEIQNLLLNLPFAVAFLFLAADGVPPLTVVVLAVVAFVGARTAGHSFNRWADRTLDAANPRTRDRALPAGRRSPAFALGVAALGGAALLVAAYLLNPLAFALAPVALAVLLGYSYTKRFTAWTTAFLGVVEAIIPGAVYIAVQGALPPVALWTVGGLLAWGTAFETIHSLGDLESDRSLGLRSIPVRIGASASVRLIPALHAAALVLLGIYGWAVHLRLAYFVGLVAIAVLAVEADRRIARDPAHPRVPFERHFAMAALFLAGSLLAVLWGSGPSL